MGAWVTEVSYMLFSIVKGEFPFIFNGQTTNWKLKPYHYNSND